MKKTIKQVLLLYLVIVILKIILSSLILAPSAFSDYYGHTKGARNLFYHGELRVHEDFFTRPPLYSILLSPSYIFNDMELVYFFMKVINALISSFIIFPAWLLSKEFFSEKKSWLLTIMIAVLPAHFSFTFFLLTENLFYPLFLFSIYFIYKSFTEKNYSWDILAGVFIGLSYLTRVTALTIPGIVFFIFLFKLFKKDFGEIKKKILMAVFFLITISPWVIRNCLITGFNKDSLLLGYGRSVETITTTLSSPSSGEFLTIFLTWFVLHLGYLMIASGFLFFTSNLLILNKSDNEKEVIFSLLTLLATTTLIILASRTFNIGLIKSQTIFPWLAGRIVGRYIEVVIPLILIGGLLGFKYLKKASKVYILPVVILIVSSQLAFFALFPINNMSLTWLGSINLVIGFLVYHKLTSAPVFSYWQSIIFAILLVTLFFIMIRLWKKLGTQKILYFFITFFSLVSLLNFAVISYNAYTFWYKGEQMQLGLWFNKYDPATSTVLFDERDGCKILKTDQTCIYNPFTGGGKATLMGFWMNDEIKVGPVDDLEGVDYVVSRHKLDIPLLKETKNGIFLYEVNKGSES